MSGVPPGVLRTRQAEVCAFKGRNSLETRIKVTGKFSITGRAYKCIAYDILSGEVHTLPQGTSAQSESTGTIWRITVGDVFTVGAHVWPEEFPPLLITPLEYEEDVVEGEILKIIPNTEDISEGCPSA